MVSGSMSFRLNEDEVNFNRAFLISQSPTRCFMLQQLAQQIETVVCCAWVSSDGNFQR